MRHIPKVLIVALLAVSILLFSGCIGQADPTQLVKNLPEVQAFLAEHPNARIVAVKISADDVAAIIDDIREDCGQQMQVKEYWYVTVSGEEEKVEVYLDTATNEAQCIIRENLQPPQDECTTNSDCDDGNPATEDTCSGTPKKCSHAAIQACKGEGETIPVIAEPPECCEGLELIPPKEENILGISGICTALCGNGVCDTETESNYNCTQDCGEEDPCENVSCDPNEKCVDGDCVLKMCGEMGGAICTGNKVCSEITVLAAGTSQCCLGTCIEPVECDNDLDCNDQDACTVDTCNDANSCVNTAITACSDNDGCCPTSCTYENDSDCEATGNLEVEVKRLGTPLSEASVEIVSENFEETKLTNGDGIALFESLSPGSYRIEVRKDGYGGKGKEIEVEDMETTEIQVSVLLENEIPRTYKQGEIILDLEGTGAYEGQKMSIKIASVHLPYLGDKYEARLELFDSEGNLVGSSQTVPEKVALDQIFLDSMGQFALKSKIYLLSVLMEPTTQTGIASIMVYENYTEGDVITGLKGRNAREGEILSVKIASIWDSAECVRCPDIKNYGWINDDDADTLSNYTGPYKKEYDLSGDGEVSTESDMKCIEYYKGLRDYKVSTCAAGYDSECVRCPDYSKNGVIDDNDANILTLNLQYKPYEIEYDLSGDGEVSTESDMNCINKYMGQKTSEIDICNTQNLAKAQLYDSESNIIDQILVSSGTYLHHEFLDGPYYALGTETAAADISINPINSTKTIGIAIGKDLS